MKSDENITKDQRRISYRSTSNGSYGLAFLGALFYFLHSATSFWTGVLGFVKAVFWPAVLCYGLLDFLKL
jgi:hypothetical protein